MFLNQIEISYRKKLLSILSIWGILHKKLGRMSIKQLQNEKKGNLG